jgi:hypothetical protein
VLSFVGELSGSAFATVRQRVARHLLDLASERLPEPASGHRSGSELVVRVSQRELAEAAGTAREVVVRVLRDLRQDGVIRTGRDKIVIADPARLIQEHGGTKVPDAGRPGVETSPMATVTTSTGKRPRRDRRIVDELGTTFRGELVRPGDGTYEQHRRVWNGSIDRYPALIARCAGVADVIDALVARKGGPPQRSAVAPVLEAADGKRSAIQARQAGPSRATIPGAWSPNR